MHKAYFHIIIIALVCSLCGCMTYSDYTTKTKPTKEVDLSATAEHAYASNYFKQGSWPSEKWWEVFEDKQLCSLITIAIENSPSLKSTEAKLREALQEANVVRAKRFPEIGFNVKDKWQHFSRYLIDELIGPQGSPVLNWFRVDFDFCYEFDFWGKNAKKYHAKLGMAYAQAAEKYQTELILSLSVAQKYFNYMALCQQKIFYEQLLQDKHAQYEIVKHRMEHRLSSNLDLLPREIDIVKLQEQITNIDNEIMIAKLQLNYLLGYSPDHDLHLIGSWDFNMKQLQLPDDLSIDLLARRADIAAQLWYVESAAELVGAAKTQFYPDLTLKALVGMESFQNDNFFSTDAYTGFLNPAVHLPIFTGGKLKANLRGKLAAFEKELYMYNDLILKAGKQAAKAVSDIMSVSDNIQEQQTATQMQLDIYNLTLSRFNNGLDNYLQVLVQNEKVLSDKIVQTQLEWDYMQNHLSLIKALGGGYHSDHKACFKEIVR